VEHQAFQPLDSFSDTVSYRDGKEVEEPGEKQTKDKPKPKRVGELRCLRSVAAPRNHGYLHGEDEVEPLGRARDRSIAVFQYSIPKENLRTS